MNADAFSGEFQNAAAAYLSEQAAMVANGPWFVKTNLTTDAAAPGLCEKTGYAPAPGWNEDGHGVVVVSGAGWVSGTTDEDALAAVRAFVRFVSSQEEVIEQAAATGANPPVQVDPVVAADAELEALATGLVEQSVDLPFLLQGSQQHAVLRRRVGLHPGPARGRGRDGAGAQAARLEGVPDDHIHTVRHLRRRLRRDLFDVLQPPVRPAE